jgi:hypothetical protein
MVMVAYEINSNMELHSIELEKIQNAVYWFYGTK